jgi:hypothetical protein
MIPKSKLKIAVQIPAWNQCEELVDCLNSLKEVKSPNFEVVVVNNGEDNTSEVIRRDFKWVTLIEEGVDLGFCKANNIGFRYCLNKKFDYILLLNGDTKVFQDTISKLLNVMLDDPLIAIAGAKNILMENPDIMWGQYGRVTWGPMLVSTVGRFEPDKQLNMAPIDVDWVICNGCMIRCSALEEIGLFDENYWMADEDVEFSFRARKFGYRTVYVDTAAILHKGSSSTNIETKTRIFCYGYFLGRNPFLFSKKYATSYQKIKLLTNVLIGLSLRTGYTFILVIWITLKNILKSNFYIIKDFASNIYNLFWRNYFFRGVIDGLLGRLTEEYIFIEVKKKAPEKKNTPQPKVFKNGYWQRFKRLFGI